MKFTLTILFVLVLSWLPSVADDDTAIEKQIRKMFAASDQNDWKSVQSVFAPKVQMDYSAIGGASKEHTPAEITSGWAAILPGFDHVVHQPHRFAISAVDSRASATCDAIALHLIEGDHWAVLTGYDVELTKAKDTWLIDRIRLNLYQEEGERSLTDKAAERVKAGFERLSYQPSPEREKPVREFFKCLTEGRIVDLPKTFARGGSQLMPFSPIDFPKKVTGRQALLKQYQPAAKFKSQDYPGELVSVAGRNYVFSKYVGKVQVDHDSTYQNAYVGLWKIDQDNLIDEFVELFNPEILMTEFPGLEPSHYSVHKAGAGPSDQVDRKNVAFKSHGDELKGHLFLPPGFDPKQRYPAFVVTGSWTSVKEQMPDTYASRLAKNGFIALTFDFRGFGESAGSLRQFESPARKSEDIVAAVNFLSKHVNVSEKISGLGICASAGYLADAAASDSRLRRICLVAPWLHNPEMTEELYKSRPGGRAALLQAGEKATSDYQTSGNLHYDQAVSEINPKAAMYVPDGVFSYYLSPAKGAGRSYKNRWAVQSWVPWLTYDAISTAELLTTPVQIIHSEKGAVPDGAKSFISKLPKPPSVNWLNNFTQEDFYYKPEAVEEAISLVSSWVKED